MTIEPKRIREFLLRLRPAAAVVATTAWILCANLLGLMQAEGWGAIAAVSGGYLLSVITAHALFAAKSVFLKERRLFIETGRIWMPLSWLNVLALMASGIVIAVELKFHPPALLMSAGLGLGALVYANVLRPEMVKLARQLRR